ncbi:MAG TPA: hemerythrin domain-containing protein [Burkholderiaceae bacterium]|nr:hemerythrin domain-containing protein [Burkholderiaceae bacterium]
MTALVWTEDLRLNQPQMDRTHEEFVELLAAVRAELGAGRSPQALAAFDRLLQHTVDHFAQEDRWMQATGFSPQNCHSVQHATVLSLMREALRAAREEARWEPLNALSAGLGEWFVQHAQMMDGGLVLHMAELRFDPVTGRALGELPPQAITHCGGASCR